ncbi:MAG: metallophosphoesterase [Saprospiraceae bacterium]|nr:metallophosphoesterase [Saprospiraceae bacterium]
MLVRAIGDTHGRDDWKKVPFKDCDKFIFIGDYFDSFDISVEFQLANFLDILMLKRRYPNKVTLLIGNHDHHYTPRTTQTYSGFNHNPAIRIHMEDALRKGLLTMAEEIDGVIYTHAGLSNKWMTNSDVSSIEEINELYHTKPTRFDFQYGDRDSNVYPSPYGDNIFQGPLWIRPYSLGLDANPATQIVGHTAHEEITNKDNIWFIDVLETKKQYVDVQDSVVTVRDFQ